MIVRTVSTALVIALALPAASYAAGPCGAATSASTSSAGSTSGEPLLTSFTFVAENDVFPHVGTLNDDRNYTGGFGFNFGGRFVRAWGLDLPLRGADCLSRFGRLHAKNDDFEFHSAMLFGTAFTPEDLRIDVVIPNDRPYGSIVGVSTRTVSVRPEDRKVAYTSEFVVGLLGTHWPRNGQRWFHERLRENETKPTPFDPKGWHLQISDGIEPTVLYRVSVERYLFGDEPGNGRKHVQGAWNYEAGAGYYTNAAIGAQARVGAFNSDYWQFTPGLLDSGRQVLGDRAPEWELFWFATARARGVLYNALMQGQLRDSAHTVTPTRLVADWQTGAGFSLPVWKVQLHVTYTASAGRSPEFKGSGRTHTWGGFLFAVSGRAQR